MLGRLTLLGHSMALPGRAAAMWLALAAFALSHVAANSPTTQPGIAASQPTRDMAAGYKLDRGLVKVAVIDLTLHDKARDKDLPLRVRDPADPRGPVPVIIFSNGAGGS